MKTLIALLTLVFVQTPSFKQSQLAHTRVAAAYQEKEAVVQGYFNEQRLAYKAGFNLFIRILKKEQKVEAWVKSKDQPRYVLIHSYDFCSFSGTLGPKRREGDYQIPEGFYHINHFNPVSNFHLSLGINYPNASDRVLSDKQHPGSAIYIHGNCVTIGCIPITDDKIKELYVLAVEARNSGQSEIPVHIYPGSMSANAYAALVQEHQDNPSLISFWNNLKPFYISFEETRQLKPVRVNSKGEYY